VTTKFNVNICVIKNRMSLSFCEGLPGQEHSCL